MNHKRTLILTDHQMAVLRMLLKVELAEIKTNIVSLEGLDNQCVREYWINELNSVKQLYDQLDEDYDH